MALFFEESIQTILLAFDEQRNRSQYRIAVRRRDITMYCADL